MPTQLPKVLVDYAWYQDGKGLIGQCSKVKLPSLKKIMEEYLAGGMAAGIQIDMAAYEPMEAKATLMEPNADALKLFGLGNGEEKPFVFRSALKGKGESVDKFVVKMQARIVELDISEIERKKPAETELTLSVNVLKIEYNGDVLIHIDAEGGIDKRGGKDNRAAINAALGI
ncbi:hypothetical protein HMF8227_02350 [Saliniradius amylolyticus]|uniref:Phage major tail tube protein n=1 Tax=Saliniradius amylolyticus TaxID=2183582 RepID=A0A2S2E5J1_9ALTE|nr:phage major tail tube protein [Saliniradius amylolyticus]AWL12802.1 hypothetical protein HMF8227_02350 [Saliniradius amylolyticus]